jgi:perosamine synthetase
MGGKFREKYEQAFKKLTDTAGARAFDLGRHALVILLKALGVTEGDKVGVCGFTCLSVIEAVKVCEATPVYLDVDEHLCINPQEILSQPVRSLKAVILQHSFGIPGRLDELLNACDKIGAKVIEDCSHSLGCKWQGIPLGKFAEGAVYSFQWEKPYTTGQGGMLTVNSPGLLEEVDRAIDAYVLDVPWMFELRLEFQRRVSGLFKRNYFVKQTGKKIELKNAFEFYRGYARFAGELTSLAGLKQLENWPKLEKLRRENCKIIEEELVRSGLDLWPRPAKADVVMLRYPILTQHKETILEKARRQGIDLEGWYDSPVHPLDGEDLKKVSYHKGDCQRVETMLARLVHLPTGYSFSRECLSGVLSLLY